jgi:UDP-N-acetylglucosamine:LPS N-acetylglucosamine transferase
VVYIHTDFTFHPHSQEALKIMKCSAIRFCLPSPDPELVPKEFINNSLINFFGFPISKVFVKETDVENLQNIRRQMDVKADEKVVIMMTGMQGESKHVLLNIKALCESTPEQVLTPLHIVIICGKNAQLKENIENQLESMKTCNPIVRFKIYGEVVQQTIANYFNIGDLLMSKPGGATTAEAVKMGIYFINYNTYPWEMCNQEYLTRNEAGKPFNDQESFIPQLVSALQRPPATKFPTILDWEHNLQTEIPLIIEQHRSVGLPTMHFL